MFSPVDDKSFGGGGSLWEKKVLEKKSWKWKVWAVVVELEVEVEVEVERWWWWREERLMSFHTSSMDFKGDEHVEDDFELHI